MKGNKESRTADFVVKSPKFKDLKHIKGVHATFDVLHIYFVFYVILLLLFYAVIMLFLFMHTSRVQLYTYSYLHMGSRQRLACKLLCAHIKNV